MGDFPAPVLFLDLAFGEGERKARTVFICGAMDMQIG